LVVFVAFKVPIMMNSLQAIEGISNKEKRHC
jgi:hypothetical protein